MYALFVAIHKGYINRLFCSFFVVSLGWLLIITSLVTNSYQSGNSLLLSW